MVIGHGLARRRAITACVLEIGSRPRPRGLRTLLPVYLGTAPLIFTTLYTYY